MNPPGLCRDNDVCGSGKINSPAPRNILGNRQIADRPLGVAGGIGQFGYGAQRVFVVKGKPERCVGGSVNLVGKRVIRDAGIFDAGLEALLNDLGIVAKLDRGDGEQANARAERGRRFAPVLSRFRSALARLLSLSASGLRFLADVLQRPGQVVAGAQFDYMAFKSYGVTPFAV